MALAAGQRRGGSPGPTLLGCVQPVWRGQSSLKPFVAAGCSFLHPFFEPFHSQPRQETLLESCFPSTDRFGKQWDSSGGVLRGEACTQMPALFT